MITRLSNRASQRKVPSGPDRETHEIATIADSKLSGRWAGIIGASFMIAACAGALTYLAAGKSGASVAGAGLAFGAAFAGALRLLNSIIAES
jgi:hypothetical protein